MFPARREWIMRRMTIKVTAALAAVLLSVPAVTRAQQAAGGDGSPPPVYDESADAAADLAAALETAAKENTRVLIQWGGNWCGWCVKLHELFRTDRAVAQKLRYEYEVVTVDIGRWDKNTELAAAYGADIRGSGVPFLTVLDAAGNVLANQETGSLEEGDHHDPARVLAFLERYQAPYPEAEALLADALRRAGREGKRLFLTFGAPW